jgi:hypothetical protein
MNKFLATVVSAMGVLELVWLGKILNLLNLFAKGWIWIFPR